MVLRDSGVAVSGVESLLTNFELPREPISSSGNVMGRLDL